MLCGYTGVKLGLLPWEVHIVGCEVCHPRCAFKLYGEVNSVKKHNYKIWLNDGVN